MLWDLDVHMLTKQSASIGFLHIIHSCAAVSDWIVEIRERHLAKMFVCFLLYFQFPFFSCYNNVIHLLKMAMQGIILR